MFPPFFNATSTARVLSLLLHFLKQIFSGPHFQDIAYQPKAASRSAAGKAAKRDSIRGKVFEGGGGGLEGAGKQFERQFPPPPPNIPNALPGRLPQGPKAAEHIRQHVFKQALRIAGSGGKHEGA